MRFQAIKLVLLAGLGGIPAAALSHAHPPMSRTKGAHASLTVSRVETRNSAGNRKGSRRSSFHLGAVGAEGYIRGRRLSAETDTSAQQLRRYRGSLTLASSDRSRVPVVRPVRLGDPARRSLLKPQVEPVTLLRPEANLLSPSHGNFVLLPALKGSHEILIRQNVMADQDGLARVQDDADLERMRLSGQLVPIPAAAGIQIDPRLPANRRYCRPWTAQFLSALASAHYAYFHSPLQVNSAVRTGEFQHRVLRRNGTAAPADGETASPHLTGQAVDLAKKGLSMAEIAWMRAYLTPIIQEGKLDVEEEFQQACFHISVYRKYAPAAVPRSVVQDRSLANAAVGIAGANMR